MPRSGAIGYDDDAPPATAEGTPPLAASNAMLPEAGDNCAIAVQTIAAGAPVVVNGAVICDSAPFTVLEGHRLAATAVASGELLTSWGTSFGRALCDLGPGSYACNEKALYAIRSRKNTFAVPPPTFSNLEPPPARVDDATFVAGEPLPPPDSSLPVPTFSAYPRPSGRGTGTRNCIVIMAVTSQASAFARALEARARSRWGARPFGCDDVVAVAHTEGGSGGGARGSGDLLGGTHRELLLRTLAGFAVHPNVGAVLCVDTDGGAGGLISFVRSGEPEHAADSGYVGTRSTGLSSLGQALTNAELSDYLAAHAYPVEHQHIEQLSLGGDFSADLRRGLDVIAKWLPVVGKQQREERPLSELILAMQCGGSDAFSGVSANPLAGDLSKRLVLWGGTALLAETDELIGAEEYVIKNARTKEVAQRFLDTVQRFKDYAARFNASAEGNPSGGNNYRGLYNITIKSLGAAKKRHSDVRLEHVVDYAEPFVRNNQRGYCFMDSPGNDLESIAGEVAGGCNVVVFTTGNGSITNFPFVPTIKILTTTGRYNLLERDIDINAGALLDGTATMESLGATTFEYMRSVASGKRSLGELAGHSQVHIWRDWPGEQIYGDLNPRCCDDEEDEPDHTDLDLSGTPLALLPSAAGGSVSLPMFAAIPTKTTRGFATRAVGLVLPTSLCSSQVARSIAGRLDNRFCAHADDWRRNLPARGSLKLRKQPGEAASSTVANVLSEILALPHTEGCGSNGGESEVLSNRTLLGYLLHPCVSHAVLLEHGCEKTHNGAFMTLLEEHGLPADMFRGLSVQLDGGIESCFEQASGFFGEYLAQSNAVERVPVSMARLRIGILASDAVPDSMQLALATLARWICTAGGTVICAGSLLRAGPFLGQLLDSGEAATAAGAAPAVLPATLAYGQQPQDSGLHLMSGSNQHHVELLTGLGATGVDVILAFVARPVQGNPLVPTVQVAVGSGSSAWVKDGVGTIPDAILSAGVDALLMPAEHVQWPAQVLELLRATTSGEHSPEAQRCDNHDFQLSRGHTGISL